MVKVGGSQALVLVKGGFGAVGGDDQLISCGVVVGEYSFGILALGREGGLSS